MAIHLWGIFAFSLTVLSVIRFTGLANDWFGNLFSHFPVQYGILSLILLGVGLWNRWFPLSVLAAVLAILNLSVFADYRPISQPSQSMEEPVTVYLANVMKFNTVVAPLHRDIQHVDPELVLLIEVTPGHLERLQAVMQSFPYRIERAMKGYTGFLFLSRYPIRAYQVTSLAEHGERSLLTATLQIGENMVTFYGVHPHTFIRRKRFHQQRRQLTWLAGQIAENPHPVIVAGDFNTTPFSAVFQELLTRSGLQDPRVGVGWYPSWPTCMPLLWLPLDHVLVSSDIRVHRVSIGGFMWSDHYPIIVELFLREA